MSTLATAQGTARYARKILWHGKRRAISRRDRVRSHRLGIGTYLANLMTRLTPSYAASVVASVERHQMCRHGHQLSFSNVVSAASDRS